MDKVIVAGGAGFIGSHLCEALLNKGYQVVCLDNLVTGSRRNIETLQQNPNFTFKHFDVALGEVDMSGVSFIFHLASPASPVDYQKHPEETALTNSLGTINLLKEAVKNKARFLLASTSEIYGDPKEHPQKETYWGNVNSYGPRSCYDEGKRFAETMVYIYHHKYGLDTRIVRIFNTYGPRMEKDDGRVVSNFINQALEGKPITIYGDGKQTRSFCYASDLVDGLMRLMFTEGLTGEVVNLGNPEEYSMLSLAEKIKALTKSSSEIIFKPLPGDDPKQRCPDIAKAKKLLDWEPKVDADEGLAKTITYFKEV